MDQLVEKTVFYELELEVPEQCGEKESVQDICTDTSVTVPEIQNSEDEWDTDLEEEDRRPSRRLTGDDCVQQFYLAACSHLKIVPCNCFLKGVNTATINLSFQGLSSIDIKAVATAMVMDRMTNKLVLAGNMIGQDGVKYICEMLTENMYITDLDVSDNNLDGAALEMIAGVFKENETLCKLKVRGNNFRGHDAEHIASIMRLPTVFRDDHYLGLRSIDLSHNDLGDEGGQILGHAIGDNETVTELDLSWNKIRKTGIGCIAKGLAENNSLKYLNLSSNGLGNDGAELISNALAANRMLETLDLSANRIGLAGIVNLFTQIANNEKLAVIKLTNNPITLQGPTAALARLLASDVTALQEIHIADACAPREFDELLSQMQLRKPGFTVVLAGYMDPRDLANPVGKANKDTWKKEPILMFIDFFETKKLGLFDMFKKLDADKSCSLSKDEFVQGFVQAGCPLSPKQFSDVIDIIDVDHNGEIDLGEFLDGYEQHKSRYLKLSKTSDSSESSPIPCLSPSGPDSGPADLDPEN